MELKSYRQLVSSTIANIVQYARQEFLDRNGLLNNLVYNETKNTFHYNNTIEKDALRRIIYHIAKKRLCNKAPNMIVDLCLENYIDIINGHFANDLAINCNFGNEYFVERINSEIVCDSSIAFKGIIEYKNIGQIVDLCAQNYLHAVSDGAEAALNCTIGNSILRCKCVGEGIKDSVRYIAAETTGKIDDICVCHSSEG